MLISPVLVSQSVTKHLPQACFESPSQVGHAKELILQSLTMSEKRIVHVYLASFITELGETGQGFILLAGLA